MAARGNILQESFFQAFLYYIWLLLLANLSTVLIYWGRKEKYNFNLTDLFNLHVLFSRCRYQGNSPYVLYGVYMDVNKMKFKRKRSQEY